MIRRNLLLMLLILLRRTVRAAEPGSVAAAFWPQWRGPLGTGEAPGADPPVRWDEKTNIRWKVPLPGLSHATPVVWGDRIFVLAATPAGRMSRSAGMFDTWRTSTPFRYEILAYDRKDGRLLWRRTAKVAPPHEGIHMDASWASCSPVTDGERVIASFGSRGVYCYDVNDGNLQWQRDFGEMRVRYQYGESTSPVLSGDRLIIQWDSEARSFLAVLDKRTGKEIWRKERSDGTSWATPLVVEHRGKKQVIVVAIRRVRSYDLDTGAVLWETRDMTAGPIPSPVAGDGVVYLMGAYLESILQAISLDKARGDAAASGAILWELDRDTSYVSSPLLYGGMLYFLKQYQNILSCFDARTGKEYYARKRLPGLDQVYSSPVAAQGRVYIAGRNGATIVLRHGPKFEVLATNTLDDRFDASPVIVGKELFLRGHENLYCIAAE